MWIIIAVIMIFLFARALKNARKRGEVADVRSMKE
jgi:hypothetical protein